MGLTACTEPQCLYKVALYLYLEKYSGPLATDELTDKRSSI